MNDPLQAALARLPHGPEFRFIDELLSLDPGRSGAGEYKVRGDAVFLRGHFPGAPLFPGVLLVEAAAQLAGTVAQSDPAMAPLLNLKLTAMRGMKILGTAVPGDTLRVQATITGRLGQLVQAHVTAAVRGRKVLEGDLTLSGDASAT